MNTSDVPESELQEAINNLQTSNQNEAIKCFKEIARKYPNNYIGWLGLCLCDESSKNMYLGNALRYAPPEIRKKSANVKYLVMIIHLQKKVK